MDLDETSPNWCSNIMIYLSPMDHHRRRDRNILRLRISRSLLWNNLYYKCMHKQDLINIINQYVSKEAGNLKFYNKSKIFKTKCEMLNLIWKRHKLLRNVYSFQKSYSILLRLQTSTSITLSYYFPHSTMQSKRIKS